MDFKQGDRVELILRSKKCVGTVEEVGYKESEHTVNISGW